jgi:hypothetical protein
MMPEPEGSGKSNELTTWEIYLPADPEDMAIQTNLPRRGSLPADPKSGTYGAAIGSDVALDRVGRRSVRTQNGFVVSPAALSVQVVAAP